MRRAIRRVADVAGRLRPIVTYPNAVLKQKCTPVAFAPSTAGTAAPTVAPPPHYQVAADLITTVRDGDGLGLAAPQVGKVQWEVAVVARDHVMACRPATVAEHAAIAHSALYAVVVYYGVKCVLCGAGVLRVECGLWCVVCGVSLLC